MANPLTQPASVATVASKLMADKNAELFFIGEIEAGVNFPVTPGSGIHCEVSLEYGNNTWERLAGNEFTQTQTSYCDDAGVAVWNHPIDLHFVLKSLVGWPKLRIQVFELSPFGSVQVVGVGTVTLPASVGHTILRTRTWRPITTGIAEVKQTVTGGRRPLADIDEHERQADYIDGRLLTQSSGDVHFWILKKKHS